MTDTRKKNTAAGSFWRLACACGIFRQSRSSEDGYDSDVVSAPIPTMRQQRSLPRKHQESATSRSHLDSTIPNTQSSTKTVIRTLPSNLLRTGNSTPSARHRSSQFLMSHHTGIDDSDAESSVVTFIQHADRSSVGSRAGKGTFGGISYTPVVVGGGDLKGRSPSNPSLCWLCNNHHTQERLCVLASDQAPAQESEAASRSTAATPSTTSASATTTISNGHSSSTVPDTVDPEFLSPNLPQ
ncbi:hypothetical protein BC829DRAFT_428884 [Chytridium lagenaria]|nr:hypothetical protein BC829DRAFT_428884 [Chytridium lagenaria]